MRLTVRHHFDFGADRAAGRRRPRAPRGWDALRTQTSGAFALAETREEWSGPPTSIPSCQARARRLDEVFGRLGAAKVVSYGAGGATLECWLKRVAPQRDLVVTDYAQATVERLKPIFAEAECVVHDLSADGPLDGDLHLFHRIDTEFENRRWEEVFERFAAVPIVFVAAGQVDLRGAVAEVRKGRRRGALAGRVGAHATGARGALEADAHGRPR